MTPDTRRLLAMILVLALLFVSVAHAAHADDVDDEREDREDGREEHEDDDDGRWDLSDDFAEKDIPVATEPAPVAEPEPERQVPTTAPASSPRRVLEVPPLDLSDYDDDDRDGIPNKDDLHHGKDDLRLKDSDSDGISDREDLFPGEDDRAFQDLDRDGVMDAKDSDIGKPTDNDHDGIDDAYDEKDDRSIVARFLSLIGLL